MNRWPAALVLENGRIFKGDGFGGRNESIGEVVFNTSITGYQEIVSDPSYAGQIVVMTATQIGNVGTNLEDTEARRVVCAGLAIRELSPLAASWRSTHTLPHWLEGAAIPGIDNIDTRALTRALRDEGAMRGAITPHVTELPSVLERVRAAPKMDGQDLVPRVTCGTAYEWTEPTWRAFDDGRAHAVPPVEFHVVAYDFGIKENILRQLRDIGARVTVVPATTSAKAALAYGADGIFLSNGPGDPAAVTYAVEATQQLCASGKPVFGICLGHQILGLALGGQTFKLPFGHHGGNHPVLDKTTGKVEITSQNHGFAVDPKSLPSGVHVSHENLFDHSVEGLIVDGKPIFSVQYHPEASPGPHDATYLFARFRDELRESAQVSSFAAALDQVTEELYARHTADAAAAAAARAEYEQRRGKVHQDDELWEPWSAAFVEWFVVERVASPAKALGSGPLARDGSTAGDLRLPPAALTYRELLAANDPRADVVRALVTSQRSLYEVRAMVRGRIELLDLLGGAEFHVAEARALHGVEVGDVAELRLCGVGNEVRFGRTFIYHPKSARDAIVERARAMLAGGATRRDVIDQIAQLRVQVTRYRHMPAARVYELGSRIMG